MAIEEFAVIRQGFVHVLAVGRATRVVSGLVHLVLPFLMKRFLRIQRTKWRSVRTMDSAIVELESVLVRRAILVKHARSKIATEMPRLVKRVLDEDGAITWLSFTVCLASIMVAHLVT